MYFASFYNGDGIIFKADMNGHNLQRIYTSPNHIVGLAIDVRGTINT